MRKISIDQLKRHLSKNKGSTTRLAKFLGIHITTVSHWKAKGDFPVHYQAGLRMYFDRLKKAA